MIDNFEIKAKFTHTRKCMPVQLGTANIIPAKKKNAGIVNACMQIY